MNEIDLLNLAKEVLKVSLLVSAPILLAVAAIGLCVSLLQALTQVQEQSLSFVPKLIGGIGICIAGGSWMLRTLVDLAILLLSQLGKPA